MSITLPDGQDIDAIQIKRVTLYPDKPRLLIEFKDDSFARYFGEDAEVAADALDDTRDRFGLHYLVHRVPQR